MKDFLLSFKAVVRFIVTISTSREFAFIYAVLGTISQIAHTYFLTSSISSFTGGFRIMQAVLLSAFISTSLLYYTCVSDNEDTEESKRNRLAVNIFACIEICINLYYYTRHLIIDAKHIQIFDFLFASIISVLIPLTIKLYATHIRAKEWVAEFEAEREDNGAIEEQLEEGIEAKHAVASMLNEWRSLIQQHRREQEYMASTTRLTVEKDAEQIGSLIVKFDSFREELNTNKEMVDKQLSDFKKQILAEVEEAKGPIKPIDIDAIKNQVTDDIEDILKKAVDIFNQELFNLSDKLPKDIITEENVIKKLKILFDNQFQEHIGNVDTEIASIFEKHKDLFLKQFENKCKMIYTQQFVNNQKQQQ